MAAAPAVSMQIWSRALHYLASAPLTRLPSGTPDAGWSLQCSSASFMQEAPLHHVEHLFSHMAGAGQREGQPGPLKLHTDRALIAVLKQVGTWCLSSLFGPSAAKLPPAELASVLSCLPMCPTRCLQATLQMSVTAWTLLPTWPGRLGSEGAGTLTIREQAVPKRRVSGWVMHGLRCRS